MGEDDYESDTEYSDESGCYSDDVRGLCWPDPFDASTESSSPSRSSRQSSADFTHSSSRPWLEAEASAANESAAVDSAGSRVVVAEAVDTGASSCGDFRVCPPAFWAALHGQFHKEVRVHSACEAVGDFRCMPSHAWAALHENFSNHAAKLGADTCLQADTGPLSDCGRVGTAVLSGAAASKDAAAQKFTFSDSSAGGEGNTPIRAAVAAAHHQFSMPAVAPASPAWRHHGRPRGRPQQPLPCVEHSAERSTEKIKAAAARRGPAPHSTGMCAPEGTQASGPAESLALHSAALRCGDFRMCPAWYWNRFHAAAWRSASANASSRSSSHSTTTCSQRPPTGSHRSALSGKLPEDLAASSSSSRSRRFVSPAAASASNSSASASSSSKRFVAQPTLGQPVPRQRMNSRGGGLRGGSTPGESFDSSTEACKDAEHVGTFEDLPVFGGPRPPPTPPEEGLLLSPQKPLHSGAACGADEDMAKPTPRRRSTGSGTVTRVAPSAGKLPPIAVRGICTDGMPTRAASATAILHGTDGDLAFPEDAPATASSVSRGASASGQLPAGSELDWVESWSAPAKLSPPGHEATAQSARGDSILRFCRITGRRVLHRPRKLAPLAPLSGRG